MDLSIYMHQNNMKQLFILFLLFFFNFSHAQDTLYLPVHGLGHEKYVLKEDGTFNYSSYLCGSTFFSFGTFKKTIFGYRFSYDSAKCPSPSILEVKNESINDSLILFFYSMVDSTRLPIFNSLSIGAEQHWCDFDSIILPRKSLNSNILTIGKTSDSLVFKFDPTALELHVYLPPTRFGYNCGINDVRKLKKTKWGYMHKVKVYDEIREEPWKKGTKRVVHQYYQLRSKNDKYNIN